jgi:hypothetical protein
MELLSKINTLYKLASDLNENEDEAILAKYNIKLLKFIGKGTQAVVYDCLYNGERVVAKIANNEHATSVAKIESIKNKLSKSAQKHFANVYEIIKIDMPDISNDKKYIILTEHLKPMNIHLRQLFFDDLSDDHDTLSGILLDKLIDKSKFDKAIDIILIQYYQEKIENYIPYQQFKDKLYSVCLPFVKSLAMMRRFDAETALYKFESKIVEFVKTIMSKKPLVYDISFAISEGLKDIIFGHIFPKASDEGESSGKDNIVKRNLTKQLSESSQVKSLLKALEELEKNNMNWFDIFGDNVMERESDNTLVISDPGMFY